MSVLACAMLASFFPIQANTKKVIRIGYPMMGGFTMKDEDGNYYGYDYDYLMQIAQYTGWEYEFVEVEGDANERILTLLDMVEKGEIDLMGGIKYSDSLTTKYDYSSEPYGSVYNVIAVKDDSDLFDVSSITNKKSIKIAVIKNSKRIALLEQFAEINGFTIEQVICESEDDLTDKVESREADAILSIDLNLPDTFHSIAKFSPDPYYFITTKGNTEIIQKLNQALVNINQINPTLSSNLYERYFSGDSTDFILNSAEKKYLEEHSEINVLVKDGTAPIQYRIDNKYYGVGKNILQYMSKKTGLKINYYYASTFSEYKKQAQSGKIDVLLGVPYEVKFADSINMNLSDPYLSSNLMLVTNGDVDPSKLTDKNQAMTHYQTQSYDNNMNVKFFESTEEILKAINSHKVDYAYVNNYVLTYYKSKYDFKNISTFAAPDHWRSQYAFAVTKERDLSLLSILNKTIRIQEDEVETYIYKNVYVQESFDLTTFVGEHLISIIIGILLTIIAVLYFLHHYYDKQLKMKKAVELEYLRYQKLSDISGEMMFSYNYQEDELKVSNSGVGKITQNEINGKFFETMQNAIDYNQIIYTIYKCLLSKEDTIIEVEAAMNEDEMRWYQLSIKIINDVEKNKQKAVYAIGKVIDIQANKTEKEELRLQSQSDPLTKLLNRRGAQDQISEALQKEEGLGALIMIDLDNFKEVNDNYGHIEGDNTLIETSLLLKQIFPFDIVGRLGGDEFIIYVSHTCEEKVLSLCQELLNEVRDIACLSQRDFTLTMSIGIVFTTYSKDYMKLLDKADEKMYDVKKQGRDSFMVYHK